MAKQAQAEVDERWPTPYFPDIRYDDVAKLRYLRRVADETLRLWPVAPGYFRQAKDDVRIGGKYSFAKKEWVFVLLQAAHRDPRAWGDDAERFNPDRFLPENLRRLPSRVYKPFGTGERACIGRQFALHEIVLALAAIVHQFELEPDPHYTLEATEHPTLKPSGLRLRVKSRATTAKG
jgi:cytochrome P450